MQRVVSGATSLKSASLRLVPSLPDRTFDGELSETDDTMGAKDSMARFVSSQLAKAVPHQIPTIHFAPVTISQPAATATASTMPAASSAIESNIPSSSR